MRCNSPCPLCSNSDRENGFPQQAMSALPPKADMCGATAYVCFGPIAEFKILTQQKERPPCGGLSEFNQVHDPSGLRTPRGASAVIHTRPRRLLARIRRSLPDLLGDLIQVPARWVLKWRELFVALELLEPQLLADGQNVPVIYPSRDGPSERTGVRKGSCLVPFACRRLEWIALEVDNAGHELGLDSRDVEAKGSFGRDCEIQLPVLVAHCRLTLGSPDVLEAWSLGPA